jgi:hypothetical protein
MAVRAQLRARRNSRLLNVFGDLFLLAAAQKHDGGQRGRAKADAAECNAEHEPRNRDGAVARRYPVDLARLVDGRTRARPTWKSTERKIQ